MSDLRDMQRKALNHFGIIPQIKHLFGEFFEFIEAFYLNNREKIIEEIADMKNMLEQVQIKYNITDDEIQDMQEYKMERTMRRIEEVRRKEESDKLKK